MTKVQKLKALLGKEFYKVGVPTVEEFFQSKLDYMKEIEEETGIHFDIKLSEDKRIINIYHEGREQCEFFYVPVQVKGKLTVRSRDVLVGDCHIQIKDIVGVTENSIQTKYSLYKLA